MAESDTKDNHSGDGSRLTELRVGYILLCSSYSKVDGKHNLIGVFDRIGIISEPTFIPKAFLVAEIQGPQGESADIVFKAMDSLGNDIIPPLSPITITFSPHGTAFINVELVAFPIPHSGFLHFRVFSREIMLGERVLFVTREEKS